MVRKPAARAGVTDPVLPRDVAAIGARPRAASCRHVAKGSFVQTLTDRVRWATDRRPILGLVFGRQPVPGCAALHHRASVAPRLIFFFLSGLSVVCSTTRRCILFFFSVFPSLSFLASACVARCSAPGAVIRRVCGTTVRGPLWRRCHAQGVWARCALSRRFAGNVLYANVGDIPGDSAPWILLASRFIIGFGAGSMAVCMAYVSGSTTVDERAKVRYALFLHSFEEVCPKHLRAPCNFRLRSCSHVA